MWEWEDEHGRWNPYGIQTGVDLETAKGGSASSVSLESCGRSYTVDVAQMEQTNDVTSIKRNVRREVSGK